ncbi:transcription termination/antitermination NusG family protein [Marinobacterium sp. xm-a-152]|uniref:transcription termination/antitermination NusG family protein n=1 Tax=Marinobacterium sp. xm-a-152 TaxID=2497733 RepID=UPI00156A1297|nr:transcription termination/antitermination NusG family protein [Marinobacterium sp. xm-a-152]NRP15040.1 Transcription antitermination protein RfaH [Marinobacterium sp. xm-a-152]
METASPPPKDPNADRLTASQAAARMGISTRQLQALRLRGIGPPIVQKGLNLHYTHEDIMHIEEHEGKEVLRQVMQLPSPLTALKLLCEHYHLKQSPIMQEVQLAGTRQSEAVELQKHEAQLSPEVRSAEPKSKKESSPSSNPDNAQKPSPNSTSLQSWYLIQTKYRQETTALTNLERQGYTCYLPKITKSAKGVGRPPKGEVMFPRYLFIQLSAGENGQNWMPIRSTRGVDKLIQFGHTYPRVDDCLIRSLKEREKDTPLQPLLKQGDAVQILDGPFKDLDAIFFTEDSEHRVLILINFLLRQLPVKVDRDKVRKRA